MLDDNDEYDNETEAIVDHREHIGYVPEGEVFITHAW